MRIACALLGLLAGSAASAQEPFERVRQPALPGFEQIVREQRPETSLELWVPRGQTLARWTRMVTVQRFTGLARRTTPVDYLRAVRRSMRAGCREAQLGAISHWALATYPTAQIWVDCPLNPASNQPEITFMRVIAGYADLYVVHVAVRVRRRDDLEFARRHLAGVMLCGPTSSEAACRNP